VPERLVDRVPEVDPARLFAELVPPPQFAGVRFDTYVPDPDEPSQAAAVAALQDFAADVAAPGRARRTLLRRRPAPTGPLGRYLDGGFGVGKTHLLASLWHAAPAPKAYATFVELTNLVGALGFASTVDALAGHRLVCVDEFELDDPGDTVLMSSLLRRLAEGGVRLAATSNTLPGKLGEGRFAADDFRREIAGLAERFEVLRIDGEDYRHRGLPTATPALAADEVRRRADAAGPGATLDDFPALLGHLARVHPSRYGPLLDGVTSVHLLDVAPVADQSVALRLVVLADRLCDRSIPVVAAGVPLDEVFPPELLEGGYRKKYRRALSRLVALAADG
jgi:cell division protein ZapE